ncbi:tetratricopeptide repeat protein [Nocardia sp. NPDC050378]|uniref:tetratricopeptide repeat protein n=1 Tax=Nocardia sp. NPDC050378 TaxID=3155400 RepID=UPI0033CFCC6E
MPVQAALERARVALEIGRAEEAREILGRALLAAPADPRVLVALAELAHRLDEYDDTIRYAGQAIRAAPDDARAHELACMGYAMRGEWEPAYRHGRIAARLSPHDYAVLLLTAWLHTAGPRTDHPRARAALGEAVALAPDNADVHCSVAETYQRLYDYEAARSHIAAGLVIDPTHVDLLRMQARTEFELGGGGRREQAVATLRGVLADAPADAKARRLLAEVYWRALIRLATWVWFFAGSYAAVAMWAPQWVTRLLSGVLFAAVLIAWFRVFRKLRTQLPPGYLRARTVRPRVLLALSLVALAGLAVVAGAAAMRSDYIAFVRLGCWLLVLAALGAAFGHLLLFTAWLRRGIDEPDPAAGADFAFGQIAVLVAIAAPVSLILWFTRGWARQPAAAGVLLVVLGIALLTLVGEDGLASWRSRRDPFQRLWFMLAVAVLVSGAAMWWGGGEIADGRIRGREFMDVPAPPTFSPRESPVLPTLRVPPLVVPPTATGAPTVTPAR